jgi:hypothetical protein
MNDRVCANQYLLNGPDTVPVAQLMLADSGGLNTVRSTCSRLIVFGPSATGPLKFLLPVLLT